MDVAAQRFSRWLFLAAGLYGLVVLLPLFALRWLDAANYARIADPLYFQAFIGVSVAWQFAFLAMSRDPPAHLWLIPAAIVEKLAFGTGIVTAVAVPDQTQAIFATLDFIGAALFAIAFIRLRRSSGQLTRP